MKIAHVCPEYYPAIGGVGQVVRELATRQVKKGHEVHVYAPAWDKNKRIKSGEEVIDGIHVHRCFYLFKAGNFGTFWPSVFTKLVKGRFDVIHSHLYAHAHFIFGAIASKMSKTRHIHTTHCPWSDAHRPFIGRILMNLSYNLFSRIALRWTDKIILITPWEKEFIKKYGADEEKLVVIPNGMSEEFFKKIKDNDFKKKNNIKGDLVLFFGRLSPTKSPENFVKVAHEILKKRPNTNFVIRGPDEGMKKTVKELIGKEKRIKLLLETRDRNEIIKMYQASEVYVLTSYREGLPLTLFEAMACGLPIVATPVNGVPYELKDGENGFLAEYGNTEEFTEKIIFLLNNKKIKEKISSNNLKKAKNYSWDIITDKTMGLYNEK